MTAKSFEEFANERGYSLMDRRPDDSKHPRYPAIQTESAWQAWNASRAALLADTPEVSVLVLELQNRHGPEHPDQLDQEAADALEPLAAQNAEQAKEIERLKGRAEAMHKWIDRVLSCVERAEQDIGGETMEQIISDGGPIYTDWLIFTAAPVCRRDYPKD